MKTDRSHRICDAVGELDNFQLPRRIPPFRLYSVNQGAGGLVDVFIVKLEINVRKRWSFSVRNTVGRTHHRAVCGWRKGRAARDDRPDNAVAKTVRTGSGHGPLELWTFLECVVEDRDVGLGGVARIERFDSSSALAHAFIYSVCANRVTSK